MQEIVNIVKTVLENREEIIFAYLFGSTVKGLENNLSDVDIAVYLDIKKIPESGSFGYKSELILEIEKSLHKKIDLVLLNESPIFLAHNIIKNGQLIFIRSEKEKVEFHFMVVRNYLDFKPIMAVQNEYLKQRLNEGSFGGS